MKKISVYFGIIAAAALTLVSCAKEIDNPNIVEEPTIEEGIPFQIVANPATKTTIAGLQTAWAADDAINLFHAIAGSTTYIDDGQFTTDETGASATFTGTLDSAPASGNTYDWYAVYPYNSYLHSVDNNPEAPNEPARFYIGRRSDQAQQQTGNSSTAHLCGSNYPLFGKVTGVAYNATPSITLSPIASFIEVKVTNKNDDPLTVTSVSFTAPEGSEIVGQYEIHFNTTPFTFTKYKTYVSDVANLTVTSGDALAKNEYATFYLGVKPFSTTAGQDIKVSVNGHEKTIHTTKNFTFQAGKMKTVNFDYDFEDAPEPTYTWEKTAIGSLVAGDIVVIADETTSTALTSANGSSSAPTAVSVTIADNKLSNQPADALQFVLEIPGAGQYKFKAINTDTYLYTTNSNNGVRIGTNSNNVFTWTSNFLKNTTTNRYIGVFVNESVPQDWRCYTSINSNIENTQTAFFKKTSSVPVTLYDINIAPTTHGSVATVPASSAAEGTEVTIAVTPDATYKLGTLTVVNDATSANIAVTENKFTMPANSVTITATFEEEKSISLLKSSINNVPAAGVDTELEEDVYSLTHATDADLVVTCDGTVVTAADVDNNADVIYDVAENTGSSRSGWIKITVDGGNTVQITVNQLGTTAFVPFNVWEDGFSNCTNGTQALTSLSGSTAGFSGSYSAMTRVYPMTGAIKVGSASNTGTFTTPALSSITGSSASLTVTFKAAGWKGKTCTLTLTVNKGTVTESGAISIASEDSMTGNSPSMTGETKTFHITGADNTTTVTFSTNMAVGIDDLVITQTADN